MSRFDLRENVSLAPFTTLGVGGPARAFVEALDEGALLDAFAWASARELPVLVLGGGSNLLVADEGFDGLVVRLALRGVKYAEDGDAAEVVARAGEPWDALVEATVARGYAGLECLSGIPGFVGATPIQNVGAYGQDVSETIVRVRVLERATGRFVELDGASCGFGYRDSRFKREDLDRFVIVEVAYRLGRGAQPEVRYPELGRELAEIGRPTLADVRTAVVRVRRRKAMVVDLSDPDSRSAGSFFMNPIVTPEVADAIDADGMPRYAASGGVKLSAAWLVERAGFPKGTTRGSAATSSKHALALVNRGDATAAEIVALAREIRDGVRERFGVMLVPEPVFVGIEL